MKSKASVDFISKSVSYVAFNMLEKLVPFILLPIIIRTVSVSAYGDYSFYLTLETVMIPLLSMNLSNMIYKEYYNNKQSLRVYVSNLFWGYFLLSIPFLFVFVFLVLYLDSKLELGNSIYLSLFLSTFFFLFTDIVAMVYRLEQSIWKYGLWQICRTSVLMVLLLSAVALFPNYYSLVFTRVIAFSVLFVFVCIILRKRNYLGFSFNKIVFQRMLAFSAPTVLYSLSSFVFSFSDRFFIKYELDSEALGIYSGIYQLSSLLAILVTAINISWMPWLFEKLSQNDKIIDKEVVNVTYFVMLAVLVIGVVWTICIKIVSPVLLTIQYYDYLNISYFFISAFVFHGFYCLVSPYLYYTGKTKYNAVIGIIVALINVTLNYFLVPYLGIVGPALTLCITWALQFVMFFIISNKCYPMPWFNNNIQRYENIANNQK